MYTCTVCGEKVEDNLITFKEHTDEHIIDVIKQEHPQWVEQDGICTKCLDYYRKEIKGE